MENKHLVLASGSPRRKELLSQLGYEFSVLVTDVEECKHAQETAEEYVKRLSLDKALAALSLLKDNPSERQHVVPSSDTVDNGSDVVVLGSDTVVVSQGQVLEKPSDFADSKRMLTQLANERHQVMTAVSVVSEEKQRTEIIITDVWFKPLSEKEIEQYWQTGEPCDKAGSYGIQGLGGRFVTRIEGSYYAVVGLPLFETDQLLQEFL
ncbi:nucleoside triphosphate pyrophosphatase YhdE [Vibrio crassostreae]|uniref:Maf family protein n=1 Tax=Vibrio crassostreae TaxID=246167 RepID=UPI001B3045EB|nr:Maf family protein [Vibrio crassostreae]CAK1736823.1 nucleoside triphosphate pyrophosphatase YhdE [Vibrio crassostreae]CAK1741084.1 nucleoside triphosphate pyrophosphatase YhdE [Vibrio crassostreae]CAK1756551.1 nucleoside triphosphate pyrophosphatase YhdE [Vibrio crassostreae]CAK1761864.1 nucleoside triphosphate pyrophosphatase YhdE [Vibrio crassostreae]CAK1763487.1 nucleoside triphosphate pyrophosphatase YhdE [Vibrio crassostreae]